MSFKTHSNSIFRSFGYAFLGLSVGWQERNVRIHLGVAVVVIASGILLQISRQDWMSIVFATGLVLMAEFFNTAIELLCDVLVKEHRPEIGQVKDMSAAAVLISAMTAIVIGEAVFIPRLLALVGVMK